MVVTRAVLPLPTPLLLRCVMSPHQIRFMTNTNARWSTLKDTNQSGASVSARLKKIYDRTRLIEVLQASTIFSTVTTGSGTVVAPVSTTTFGNSASNTAVASGTNGGLVSTVTSGESTFVVTLSTDSTAAASETESGSGSSQATDATTATEGAASSTESGGAVRILFLICNGFQLIFSIGNAHANSGPCSNSGCRYCRPSSLNKRSRSPGKCT